MLNNRNEKYITRIEGASDMLREKCYGFACDLYGSELSPFVEERLSKELGIISENQWNEIYLIGSELAQYSTDRGYCVTARGNIGASFVAFLLGMTEISPLRTHYVCHKCHWIDPDYMEAADFGGQERKLDSSVCPACGTGLRPEGVGIRPEMAWGIHFNKKPDIILNFAPEIVGDIIGFLKEKYGESNIIGAGTKLICDDDGSVSYGTHPGGIFIVPEGVDVADLTDLKTCTRDDGVTLQYSQRDYHEMEKYLKKYDILSHDKLGLLKEEETRTGIPISEIPMDDTWMGNVSKDQIIEFYEEQDRPIADIVSPGNFEDLVKIEGLSHADFFIHDAEGRRQLIETCNKYGITCRDDLLDEFLSAGLEIDEAYKIMLHVSRGKGFLPEMEERLWGKLDADYIKVLKEIRYLYPRSMTASYAMITYRLLYYCFCNYPKTM